MPPCHLFDRPSPADPRAHQAARQRIKLSACKTHKQKDDMYGRSRVLLGEDAPYRPLAGEHRRFYTRHPRALSSPRRTSWPFPQSLPREKQSSPLPRTAAAPWLDQKVSFCVLIDRFHRISTSRSMHARGRCCSQVMQFTGAGNETGCWIGCRPRHSEQRMSMSRQWEGHARTRRRQRRQLRFGRQ